ncbi:hypothetical protein [Micromonospora craterilacus]|uniref:hypothetical protein n=1 Tax=Micromonospora craterilacus TaxID=1655439 RepID=UPI0018F412B7|nr:hypothetical protein [Micromonospora craterilacus]
MGASRKYDGGVDRSPKGLIDPFLAWLIHPVTVAATVLLILNDHVLKAAYPGWLTGKLSDVAGLVMAPPLAALVLASCCALPALRRAARAAVVGGAERPRHRPSDPARNTAVGLADLLAAIAIFLVGAGFTAVKASPAGAALASSAWSVVNGPSVILADVSDLLALPALALAWWTWRSAAARPTLARWLRMVAVLVVLPIAGLGVAATSAVVYDDAVTIVEWRGTVLVGIGNAFHKDSREPYSWWASKDDGLTFSSHPEADEEHFWDGRPPPASEEDCSAREPRHCFRIVPHQLAVEESQDGGTTWRVAWQIDEEARQRLGMTYPGVGDVREYLSSRALVVRDQPGGGVVVMVANGRDGLVRRDASGDWERIGLRPFVGRESLTDDPPQPIPNAMKATVTIGTTIAAPLSLAVGSMVVFIGCSALLARRHGWFVAPVAVVVGLPGLLVMAIFIEEASAGVHDGLFIPLGMMVGLTLVPAIVAVPLAAADPEPSGATVGGVCLAGLLAGAAVPLPYLVRLQTGWPSQTMATTFALTIAVMAILASIPLAIWHALRRIPRRRDQQP